MPAMSVAAAAITEAILSGDLVAQTPPPASALGASALVFLALQLPE